MTILCDYHLGRLVDQGLISVPPGFSPPKINPASIDIRAGFGPWVVEHDGGLPWGANDLEGPTHHTFVPGELALVSTLESFKVPNGYAMDLRLKSSSARHGWDHAMAFWVDPGWEGVLTMELKNATRFQRLMLSTGDWIAQVIVHELSGAAEKPYKGKYQGATTAQGEKW